MVPPSHTPDEARRRLCETMAGDGSYGANAEQALELGRTHLGDDHAHLVRVDLHTDYWEAVASTDPADRSHPDSVTDLRTTYRRRTSPVDSPVALHGSPDQGWADDPTLDARPEICERTARALDGESTTAVVAPGHGAFDTWHGPLVTDGGDPVGTVGFAYLTDRERQTQARAE